MSKIVIKDYIPFKQYVLDVISNNYTLIKECYFNSDLSGFVPPIPCPRCFHKIFKSVAVKNSIDIRCKKCECITYFTNVGYLNVIDDDTFLGYKLKWLYIREVITIKL